MKTIIFLSIFFELLFTGILSTAAQDKTNILTKRIEKQFTKRKEPLLFINTERGIVSIEGWSQPEIKVVLKLTAKNVNIEIARKELESMDYTITETYNSVYVNNRMNLAKPDQEISSVILAEYKIFVPFETNIHVENRFGKLEIDHVKGFLEGELHYSDLSLNNKIGNLNMLIDIGDFNFTKSKFTGSITARHSNASISETSGRFNLVTEYGNLRIVFGSEVLDIGLKSNATDINIENKLCHSLELSLTGTFCPLKITGNCYGQDKKYLKTDYKPNTDQSTWKMNYLPPAKSTQLHINAKFGTLNLY